MSFQLVRDGAPWNLDTIKTINYALGTALPAETDADIATHNADAAAHSAALAAFIAATHTWTAAQTISLTTTGAAFTIRTAEDSASEGPTFTADRNSASPAAADVIGAMIFSGRDSNGNVANYGRLRGVILDPTDGSEDGQFVVLCLVAGAATNIASFGGGVQIGTPTGGDPGVGNLNVDGVIQKDGTQVVSGRKTGWTMPTGTASRATFDTATVTTAQLAQRFFALMQDLGQSASGHGLTDA